MIGRPLGIALPALAIAQLFGGAVHAQIVTDGTLGPARSLLGPNFAITANLGRQVGTNLFHSFAAFNLASGQSATFSGPTEIANIISRVTGGTVSSIDGSVRSSINGATLFLLIPRAIRYGPNAT